MYITGHNASAAYLVQIPSAGSILIWVQWWISQVIAGQGIVRDRSVRAQGGNGKLYEITRECRQVVDMRVPLQVCRPNTNLSVGKALAPGTFVDLDSD
jgi:hypothetical protein